MLTTSSKRFPFSSLPSGWYAVGFSKQLPHRGILSCHYFGEDFVLFRTESGVVQALDAFCPHMGAHLAQGKVTGERLRCGFHGFEFDGRGSCVANAYGTKCPPRAKVKRWPVREVNGFLLVYYDWDSRSPTWEIPALEDFDSWTPLRTTVLELASHPQETSENSVDFGHFTQVHGFIDAWEDQPVKTDGPLLTTSYGVVRGLDFLKMPTRGIKARFDVEVRGLGYSLVSGEIPRLGLRFRHFVLSTPIEEARIELRLATQAPVVGGKWLSQLANEVMFRALHHEVTRDAPIWEAKRYLDRPMLAKGDGPIGVYRRWARQFYPSDNIAAAEAAE